ncbi:glycosyltransferase family 2 protein [uncultured Aquabacterium sp.]|uniref:glycosyltransferase family 2 protein n=1 Tax=uncultured Aquabacterium sp. TaxID=158753 RepID=UPI0025D50A29|nr:glycosyltransferase family 2 protein [uncultured Aquabacterium sp.]
MTKPPKISIVIACYNYAKYVALAIESALRQSYSHKEIVVVNDGSKDNSLEVIGRYADQVQLIDQPNQGHIAACNNGFKAATGDIVIFLDADDLLDTDTLEKVAQAWRPNCSKLQYDVRIIDADGRDLGRRFCHFTADYDADRVRSDFKRTGTYRWPVTVGNAYCRAFLAEVMPLTVSEAPDGWLNTIAPAFGDVITIPEVLGSYRVHGSNLWSNTGNDNAKLPRRISHRQLEIAAMKHWAQRKGLPPVSVNPLDYELPFINYRLMAMRLGLDYAGRDKDNVLKLVWAGCTEGLRQPVPWTQKIGHLGWFPLIAILPKALLQPLIRFRYNRSDFLLSVKRRLQLN